MSQIEFLQSGSVSYGNHTLDYIEAKAECRFTPQDEGGYNPSKEQIRCVIRSGRTFEYDTINTVNITSPSIDKSPSVLIDFNGTGNILVSRVAGFGQFYLTRQSSEPIYDQGTAIFKDMEEWTVLSDWYPIDWLNLAVDGEYYIHLSAETSTAKMVEYLGNETEVRMMPLEDGTPSANSEQFRIATTLRIRQNHFKVLPDGCTLMPAGIHAHDLIYASFNGTPVMALAPGSGFGNWFLMSQQIQCMEKLGGLMVSETQEYKSVSDWTYINWLE
jgi:hypothetical protein